MNPLRSEPETAGIVARYTKFIGSWAFFSISTAIGVAGLLQRFGQLEATGWFAAVVEAYLRSATTLGVFDGQLSFEISASGSLIVVSWGVVLAPVLLSIYKHLTTPRGTFLFILGIVIFAVLLLFGTAKTYGDGSQPHEATGLLIAMFIGAVAAISLFIRGAGARKTAFLYFSKHLAGAAVIVAFLILTGSVDLVDAPS